MTDTELSARVARECFGWEKSTDGVWWPPGEIPLVGAHLWDPVNDPRDADRVWDWICENLPSDCHLEISHHADGSGGLCIDRWNAERRVYGVWLDVDTAWTSTEEMKAVKKRALCLAALQVAEENKAED